LIVTDSSLAVRALRLLGVGVQSQVCPSKVAQAGSSLNAGVELVQRLEEASGVNA